ncbi:HAD family hydrolase [Streptacidiphilus sp. 4-A2]|nr:HAD family hydrolase [Streptacidiphilus sp. 4-A2]
MTRESKRAAALFDVDGTLVDTSYLHTVAWWEALRQGGQVVPMAAVHRAVGLGTGQLLERLIGPDRARARDSELADARSALDAAYWPALQPLPGRPAAARLRRTGLSGGPVDLGQGRRTSRAARCARRGRRCPPWSAHVPSPPAAAPATWPLGAGK